MGMVRVCNLGPYRAGTLNVTLTRKPYTEAPETEPCLTITSHHHKNHPDMQEHSRPETEADRERPKQIFHCWHMSCQWLLGSWRSVPAPVMDLTGANWCTSAVLLGFLGASIIPLAAGSSLLRIWSLQRSTVTSPGTSSEMPNTAEAKQTCLPQKPHSLNPPLSLIFGSSALFRRDEQQPEARS